MASADWREIFIVSYNFIIFNYKLNEIMLNFVNVSSSISILLLIIILIIHAVLMAYILIDISRSQFKDPNNKILWTIIVLMAPIVGITLYLSMGKNQKIKKM